MKLEFATPRKLPKARDLAGKVVVLDLAFASEAGGSSFEKGTLPFIEALGPRLVAWVDHHDSAHHARYSKDARFVLSTKAEHGACPEMITETLVARIGPVDTIVCHNDFDGLASAAKWIRRGVEPYEGCDLDARAIDTRAGASGPTGERFDRALRGRPRDKDLCEAIVSCLVAGLGDVSYWATIDAAASALEPLEKAARALATHFVVQSDVAFVEASQKRAPYDKTLLLLLGQRLARVSVVAEHDSITIAAPFDSGRNFLELFQLSGGMPTVVSLPRSKLDFALEKLGLSASEKALIVAPR